MNRILYLMRHAQAIPGTSLLSDKDRTLTAQGKHDALKVGTKLRTDNSTINLIVSSPATRAIATARLVAQEINMDTTKIQIEENFYRADKIEILKILNTISDSVTSILLVGHYPTIIELHNYLSATKSLTSMNTAELCALTFEMPWSELTESSGRHEFSYHPYLTNL
jgi:phosphohistidine phosphatase